jgi:hypothetical protein
MPIEKIEDKMYRIYDEAVSIMISNLYQSSISTGKIQLLSFNRNNVEHLCMLRAALLARDLFDVEIEIDAPWFDVLRINWKIRKSFKKIKKMVFDEGSGIPTSILLNYIRSDMEKYCQSKDFSFADVYHTYYEGSLN